MKPLLLLKPSRLIIALLALAMLTQSCKKKEPGYWKNEQIPASDKERFDELNDELIKAMRKDDKQTLENMLSKELLDDPSTKREIELVANRLKADTSYAIMNEYYVVNKYNDRDTIIANKNGVEAYELNYPAFAEEMYIAFLSPAKGPNKELVTIMYANYVYGWKLCKIDVGPYTINNKTAPQLYSYAKDSYAQGQIVEALNTLALTMSCLHPSQIWQYTSEQPMAEIYAAVGNDANKRYPFPYAITAVTTRPQIFGVFNKTTPEGSFPQICYQSKINLKDTAALKAENLAIRKALPAIMPGVDQNKAYVYYLAYNERPTVKKQVKYFEMVQKLK
ncbi:hypothetical protein LJ707_15585 [Mucilaginibacter sp. UR6-1]|uniref:hypothetical protein n=1 Tax=Mucilaginibacter sp. UR6-1 TaxID=1435643 RepID=UPI001E4E59E8|nr:hypothetical protein [Mucilaginibacter sp. UR6-1]MCC8410363.1 hypothetical protein [Mucilaginibacter sp. UR6-1]